MAKRPISHQLEEQSKTRLRSILPCEWIIRSQVPDYGLDEQVQIVEQELVTPLLFAVQLKATEKLSKKKNFIFSTERLRDYAALNFPVMIAVYDAVNNCFYYTWAHHLRQRLDRSAAAAWLVQKSVAIPLDAPLNSQSINAVMEEVSSFYAQLRSDGQGRPVPIAFEYDAGREAAYQQFSASLGTVGYSLRRVPRPQASLTLLFSDSGLTLLREEATMELPLAEDSLWVPGALALLTVGLAWVDRARLSLDCLQQLLVNCSTVPNGIDYVLSCTPLLPATYGSGHRTSEAQLLAETLVEVGQVDLGILLGSAFLYDDHRTPQHVLKASRILKQALALTTENARRATMLYSLANNYRSQGQFRDALDYYFQAARAAKEYLRKSYWWAEAAGCLFEMGKYRYAENFYRKALTYPGQENAFNRELLADTLFYQGRYQQAAQLLDEAFAQNPPTAYAVILYHASSALAAQVGNQPRDPAQAEQLYFAATDSDETVTNWQPERALQALQLDPLFAPAYFTLGVQAAQKGENDAAAWHFLFAAFLNQHDIEAWANAIILFADQLQDESSIGLVSAVFARAYQVHGLALKAEFLKTAPLLGAAAAQERQKAQAFIVLARKCEAMYAQPSASFFRIPNLQQSANDGDLWFSKDSVPDIR